MMPRQPTAMWKGAKSGGSNRKMRVLSMQTLRQILCGVFFHPPEKERKYYYGKKIVYL